MSKEQNMNTSQGHWILAKMGKRVLRPGGKELSMKMIEGLSISPNDDVVEFAPGLGFTAGITLGKNPKSYTGVELNEEAAGILKNRLKGKDFKIIIGNAAESTWRVIVWIKSMERRCLQCMQTTENRKLSAKPTEF